MINALRPPVEFLKKRLESGEFDHLDVHWATFMADLAGTNDARLIQLFASLSQAQRQQKVCLDISDKPDLQGLLAELPTVTTTSYPSSALFETPLVLCDGRLYTQKFYEFERRIAEQLKQRNQPLASGFDFQPLLDQLFTTDNVDWQKAAAWLALNRQLCFIVGGPGTGKTSTVVKILYALLSEDPSLNIKLAAPTGKAAMRLTESIKASRANLPDQSIPIPDEVRTLHRLLGMRSDSESYRHTASNQLTADVLIVDEVSMLDLAMFERLLSATPEHTRLILLGDADQLPAVDTGPVLTDLNDLEVGYSEATQQKLIGCLGADFEAPTTTHELTDAVCRLRKSYRFSDDTGLGKLAASIRRKNPVDRANDEHVIWQSADEPLAALKYLYQDYWKLVKQHASAPELLDSFDKVRALSPTRVGLLGTETLNEQFETFLRPDEPGYYHGKPVMVSRNDYNLGLFNGDIGICIQDEDGTMRVAFRALEGEVAYYLATRLPQHETCFVMTVHKSQGSEFDTVALLLPRLELDNEPYARELIYTAVTRAKEQILIYGSTEDVNNAIQQNQTFHDGIARRLKKRTDDGQFDLF